MGQPLVDRPEVHSSGNEQQNSSKLEGDVKSADGGDALQEKSNVVNKSQDFDDHDNENMLTMEIKPSKRQLLSPENMQNLIGKRKIPVQKIHSML